MKITRWEPYRLVGQSSRAMNRPALRAKLRAKVNHAEQRLRDLHAARDWLGVRQALPAYWLTVNDWRAAP